MTTSARFSDNILTVKFWADPNGDAGMSKTQNWSQHCLSRETIPMFSIPCCPSLSPWLKIGQMKFAWATSDSCKHLPSTLSIWDSSSVSPSQLTVFPYWEVVDFEKFITQVGFSCLMLTFIFLKVQHLSKTFISNLWVFVYWFIIICSYASISKVYQQTS